MKKIFLSIIFLVLIQINGYCAGYTFEKSNGGTVHASNTFSWTPSITGKAEIYSVTVHFSAATDEEIQVILDSQAGATYDTVIASSGTTSRTDFFWVPDNTFIIERGDDIRITVATGAGAEQFAITLKGEYR